MTIHRGNWWICTERWAKCKISTASPACCRSCFASALLGFTCRAQAARNSSICDAQRHLQDLLQIFFSSITIPQGQQGLPPAEQGLGREGQLWRLPPKPMPRSSSPQVTTCTMLLHWCPSKCTRFADMFKTGGLLIWRIRSQNGIANRLASDDHEIRNRQNAW